MQDRQDGQDRANLLVFNINSCKLYLYNATYLAYPVIFISGKG